MLKRTHLALGVLFALILLPLVSYKWSFFLAILVASLLPDIDSMYSTLGSIALFRPLQWVTKHRGLFHSFTFCILLSAFLALFFPLFALPIFAGYSLHLLADSFTIEGIKPYWPSRRELKGPIRTGGIRENYIFWFVILLSVVVVIFYFL